MAFEPRRTDSYTSGDSITGKRDKTADENATQKVVTYSSLKAASTVVGQAGYIFYAAVEKKFYGVVGLGNSTVTAALN
jgi:hypothetical protein